MQGRFKDALEQAAEAVEMAQLIEEPDLEANWYLTKAYIYFLGDDLDECSAAYTQAQELAVNVENSNLQRLAQFFRCLVDIKKGDIDQAESNAEKLKVMIQKGMNKKEMRLYNLVNGSILIEKGNTEDAVKEFQNGISLLSAYNGTEAWYLNAMAEAFYQSQEFEKAQRVLEDSVNNISLRFQGEYFFSKNLFQMGQILEAKGMKKEAKKYYAEFLHLWEKADDSLDLKKEAQTRLNSL
jgi:tetratricopeptide (TPR) repeat protein